MTSQKPSSLKAVVFDLDGLMFNTEELYIEVGSELLRRRGHTFGDELRHKMMGRPSPIALQLMVEHHGLVDTVTVLQEETDTILEVLLRERLAPMPGLVKLLAAFEHAGIPKAIATSARRKYVSRVLAPFELEPRFSFILSSEDVTHGKPDPEIYLKGAARFGLAPKETMVLEDSQNGCRAALAAGAFTVAVPGTHNAGQDYAGVNLIAQSLADPRIYAALGLAPPA